MSPDDQSKFKTNFLKNSLLQIYEEEKQMWMGQAEARQAVEEEALKYMDLDEEEWDFIVNDVAQQKAAVRPPGKNYSFFKSRRVVEPARWVSNYDVL